VKILARLVSGLGRLLLGSALTLAFVALAMFGVASYLVAWPYRKLYSPREASMRLTMDILTVASVAWHLRAAQAAEHERQAEADRLASEPAEPPQSPRVPQ
jgi:uncharacterized membrane protein YqjE